MTRLLTSILIFSLFLSCNYTTQNKELQASIAKEDTARLNTMVQDMVTDVKENMEATGDPDIDFARIMMLHHQRVIEMASLVNLRTKDSAIKIRTQRLTTRMQEQDSVFVSYITSHEPDYNNDSFYIKSVNVLNAIKNQSVVVSSKPIVDQGFINLVAIQHKIAIAIAKIYHGYSREPMIDSMANAIILSGKTIQ